MSAPAGNATLIAVVLAAGLSGAATAGEDRRSSLPQGAPPNTVTTAPAGTANGVATWAAAYSYQVARKCLDNILPECPSK